MSVYPKHVAEDELRHESRRAVDGDADEPPHIGGGPREEKIGDASTATGPLQQRLVVLRPLEQVGAGDHHPLHPVRPHRPRHMVRHEPPVAGPHHRNPRPARRRDAEGVEEAGECGRLEGLGPLRRPGGGAAEEEKVRHDEVEAGGEGRDLAAPLPRGAGPESMDEEERGLRLPPRSAAGVGSGGGGSGEEGGRDPAMDGGVGVDCDGVGAEAGCSVGAPDKYIHQPHQAKPHLSLGLPLSLRFFYLDPLGVGRGALLIFIEMGRGVSIKHKTGFNIK